jgi:hypothetical protein
MLVEQLAVGKRTMSHSHVERRQAQTFRPSELLRLSQLAMAFSSNHLVG